MTALKVLFIGGTGIISSECVKRAVAAGHDVSVFNRGRSQTREIPSEVTTIVGDIRDPESARTSLAGKSFDVVCDFVAFVPQHVQTDIDLFDGAVRQYVFISSASAYQKPVGHLPIVESTPLRNPYWQYSRDKIACEDLLVGKYRDTGFPATIVRPSHTYDRTAIPVTGRWTTIERMRRGEPVVVHGDGTSLWHMTHSVDFAHAFVGLLGHPQAIGDSFHITGDEVLTWDQIYTELSVAAGNPTPRLVHVASETIAAVEPAWGPGLVGDKAHSVLFDNTKVKRLVPDYVATIPFSVGAREIVDWFDADESRRVIDPATVKTIETLVERAG